MPTSKYVKKNDVTFITNDIKKNFRLDEFSYFLGQVVMLFRLDLIDDEEFESLQDFLRSRND